ncbi:MAG: hypothetical protein KDD76_03955, partial [Rickettsiales bacterium]|nr:hypothetical protein [Rickettsiales bacterium]
DWVTPDLTILLWLLLLGFVANFFQVALSHAIAAAEFRVIVPFDFTRLIFTAILAYFLFDEIPDQFTWLGGIIIIAASAYTAWREAMHSRRRKKMVELGE